MIETREKIDASQLDLKDTVVNISRVTKVVKGGKNLSFSALVVVGDGHGVVGFGVGKAKEVPSAIKKGIVANPNCVAIPLCVALKPLHDLAKVKRVVVSTYQSSSGKGATGLQDFEQQLGSWLKGEKVTPTAHRGQLAGNVITLDWTLDPNGYTEEENKVVNETKKILGDQSIAVSPTCVRVPVKVSHCEAVNVEFENPISPKEAREILRESPGVLVVDNPAEDGYTTPIECVGDYATFVSRIREDATVENGLSMWVVSDNLRKGAALNAVQIAELMLNRGMFKMLAA